MRRIIHNSTAIAACLSILMPNLATAQAQVPAPGAAAEIGAPAGEAAADPLLLAQNDQQLTEEQLRKRKLRQEQRAAEKEAAAAAAAAEQQKARAEARKERAETKAAREEKKADRKAERAEARADAKADAEADAEAKADAKVDAKAEARAERRDDKAAREAERADDAQTRDARKAERQDAKADRQEAKAERAEKKKMSDDELAEALARKQHDRKLEQKAERAAERQREDDQLADALSKRQREAQRAAAQPAAVSLATSDTARTRAGSMGGLNDLLDREVAGGLDENRLACASGGVAPCADGDRYVTPRGVVLERNSNGNYMLAPADAQIYRVTGDGEVVARDSSGRNQRSAAEREALRETRAATAAALDERRQRLNIIEQRITEANRRRSSEDFRAGLRAGLNRSGQQQQQADDGDDKSDLMKALLLGAGALAVGAMLNNNRQVALSTPDRVVVTRPDGSQEIIKDEVALLRQPGSTVTTENFDDGSSRTIVTRPDGSKVVTIRDADLRVLRRTLVRPDGSSMLLIDDTEAVQPVDIARLPAAVPATTYGRSMDEEALRAALQQESAIDRRFTLGQIRNIPEVRSLVAPVDIEAITFDTGSAAIPPEQAQSLSALGEVIGDAVAQNPREMFLIEGHTDSVGSDAANLALSDRRAESVALALTEYFDVPPENLVVQGYGEQYPKIRAEGDIRENRRASVRRITDLLNTAEAQ